jgi:hypothetical protein
VARRRGRHLGHRQAVGKARGGRVRPVEEEVDIRRGRVGEAEAAGRAKAGGGEVHVR